MSHENLKLLALTLNHQTILQTDSKISVLLEFGLPQPTPTFNFNVWPTSLPTLHRLLYAYNEMMIPDPTWLH